MNVKIALKLQLLHVFCAYILQIWVWRWSQNVKIENLNENFSRQYDKALRRATKRKITYTKKTPSDLSREYQSRRSSLWKIIFIDDSPSWSVLSRMAYPEIRRNRILDTHSFHRVISTKDALVLLCILHLTSLIITLIKNRMLYKKNETFHNKYDV